MSKAIAFAAGVAMLLSAGLVSAEEIPVDITVSPNVINLSSKATVVTIHTDIPFSLVEGATVELDGIDISWWKSDDRGYFVAKFEAAAVKGIVEAGTVATLTLSGETKDGVPFSGTDQVKVVDVKGK